MQSVRGLLLLPAPIMPMEPRMGTGRELAPALAGPVTAAKAALLITESPFSILFLLLLHLLILITNNLRCQFEEQGS